MEIWEIILVSIALAMDAFAVSICKGLASREKFIKTGIACAIWFGVFQGLMPFLGWLLAQTIASYLDKFSGLVAFLLLAFLGVKMIKEALNGEEDDHNSASLAPNVMVVFALATSVDALAAGITFAVTDVNILLAISLIGLITAIFCFIGSIIGAKIGAKFKDKATIFGGVVLSLMAIKFLVEFIINFL